jgi:very-short-patch-repair endonuclease
MGDRDLLLAELAQRQHGLFTLDQARELGCPERTIRRRVDTGALRRVGTSVLAVGGSPPTWRQRVLAGCLALDGSASHESGAELHEIFYVTRGLVVVSVRPDGLRSGPVDRVHESNNLSPRWLTTVDGITVTTPARTIVDLAAVLRSTQLEHVIDDALGRRATFIDELVTAFDALACRGRRGIARLRPLLVARGDGVVADTTELERLFTALLRRHGLPEPDRQVTLGGERPIGRVDFLYRSRRLIVEVDGRLGHSQVLDLEKDHRRDQESLVAGLRVVRVTYRQLTQRPDEVVRVLRHLLLA